MNLRILLPFGVFADLNDVCSIVVETPAGAFGLLEHRLDCVAGLVPGILSYSTAGGGHAGAGGEDETFVAVDQGILVKHGALVQVSVRRALAGTDLALLRDAVEQEFEALDDDARSVRQVMAKLETGFLRRFAGVIHD